MDEVQFVMIEDDKDLALSFSFKPGTQFRIEGFIIQRNPALEFALMPHECGPIIDWTEDDERILVKAMNLTRRSIMIKTKYDVFEFDISKISDEEYNDVITILMKMNFDSVFKFAQS
ncbi:hypothetical protein JW964_28630 [candidate division KSB1 bacterium]|nr:hypothetical protein [candidate division KSB1 bacterium]